MEPIGLGIGRIVILGLLVSAELLAELFGKPFAVPLAVVRGAGTTLSRNGC